MNVAKVEGSEPDTSGVSGTLSGDELRLPDSISRPLPGNDSTQISAIESDDQPVAASASVPLEAESPEIFYEEEPETVSSRSEVEDSHAAIAQEIREKSAEKQSAVVASVSTTLENEALKVSDITEQEIVSARVEESSRGEPVASAISSLGDSAGLAAGAGSAMVVTGLPEPELSVDDLAMGQEVVPPRIEEFQTGQQRPSVVSSLGSSTSGLAEHVEPVMVVIGSPGLSVNSLTREQVRAIFLGKTTRLPSGELVTAVAQNGNSSVEEMFYQDIIGKTPRQFKIHWTKIRFQGKQHPPEFLANDAAVRDRVAHSSGVIGLITNTAADSSVKILLVPGN